MQASRPSVEAVLAALAPVDRLPLATKRATSPSATFDPALPRYHPANVLFYQAAVYRLVLDSRLSHEDLAMAGGMFRPDWIGVVAAPDGSSALIVPRALWCIDADPLLAPDDAGPHIACQQLDLLASASLPVSTTATSSMQRAGAQVHAYLVRVESKTCVRPDSVDAVLARTLSTVAQVSAAEGWPAHVKQREETSEPATHQLGESGAGADDQGAFSAGDGWPDDLFAAHAIGESTGQVADVGSVPSTPARPTASPPSPEPARLESPESTPVPRRQRATSLRPLSLPPSSAYDPPPAPRPVRRRSIDLSHDPEETVRRQGRLDFTAASTSTSSAPTPAIEDPFKEVVVASDDASPCCDFCTKRGLTCVLAPRTSKFRRQNETPACLACRQAKAKCSLANATAGASTTQPDG